MEVKERRPYRSLTARQDAERRYTSSSADSEDGKPNPKSYSSTETLKAFDHDSRMAYGTRVKDMVHHEVDEFSRQGSYIRMFIPQSISIVPWNRWLLVQFVCCLVSPLPAPSHTNSHTVSTEVTPHEFVMTLLKTAWSTFTCSFKYIIDHHCWSQMWRHCRVQIGQVQATCPQYVLAVYCKGLQYLHRKLKIINNIDVRHLN